MLEDTNLSRVSTDITPPRNSNLPDLSDPQERALVELAAGKSVTAAAVAAGVHRCTVHQWMQKDPAFTAAYHAWQTEVRESARARLMALTDSAVSAVTRAIDKDDTKTAVTILKGLGLLTPIAPGTTDEQELTREQEIERRKRESELDMAEAMARLGV